MEFICSVCIVCPVTANSEEDAIKEFAQRITNMNASEIADYIEATEKND